MRVFFRFSETVAGWTYRELLDIVRMFFSINGIRQALFDPSQLARNAIASGADVIGMAGGDGSLGLVAGVASEHDVAMVVVPAGTRNHGEAFTINSPLAFCLRPVG